MEGVHSFGKEHERKNSFMFMVGIVAFFVCFCVFWFLLGGRYRVEGNSSLGHQDICCLEGILGGRDVHGHIITNTPSESIY